MEKNLSCGHVPFVENKMEELKEELKKSLIIEKRLEMIKDFEDNPDRLITSRELMTLMSLVWDELVKKIEK